MAESAMAPLLHPAAPLNFEEASEGGRASDLLKFVSSFSSSLSSGQLGDDGRGRGIMSNFSPFFTSLHRGKRLSPSFLPFFLSRSFGIQSLIMAADWQSWTGFEANAVNKKPWTRGRWFCYILYKYWCEYAYKKPRSRAV